MLIDNFGREINYMRISLTKNCNFRCLYCMPHTQDAFCEDLIELDSMLEFVKVALDCGIRKIRLTGGEPLLRDNLAEFIAGIYHYGTHLGADIEVALTTNGFLLQKNALALKKAGLKRINISLDSLKRDKIIKISKKDALDSILLGIASAKSVNLGIKLNMIPLRGINDDEIIDILEFANKNHMLIRYIEYMDNIYANKQIQGLKSNEILEIISQKYRFKMLEKKHLGSAKIYELEDLKFGDKKAVFGIIAPYNDEFCLSCNRIRLTSEGRIYPCLYFEESIDASVAIRNNDKIAMKEALLKAIKNKPEKNKWQENECSNRAFYHTGG